MPLDAENTGLSGFGGVGPHAASVLVGKVARDCAVTGQRRATCCRQGGGAEELGWPPLTQTAHQGALPGGGGFLFEN